MPNVRTKPKQLPATRIVAAFILVIALILTAHWPVLSAGALSLDDTEFLTNNDLVRSPGWPSARTFLSEVMEPSTVRGYYLPLSMISLMGDYAMGGKPDNLMPFHRTSLFIHILNSVLLIILMGRIFGWGFPVFVAGLLFAIHPLTVEPIVWIGERKTLLASFFALLVLLAHERHARHGGWRWLFAATVAFAMAMMSKPTAVMLPLLLIVLDYWPLARLNKRALLEKLPILSVAAVFTMIAFLSHAKTAGFLSTDAVPVVSRILLPVYLAGFYLWKIFWPVHLTPIYALPNPFSIGNATVLLSAALITLVAVATVVSLKRTRAALAGVLFFFVALSPTMGLVRYSWVTASDKYVYLPAFGLVILAAWWIQKLWEQAQSRQRILFVCALALVFAMEIAGSHRAASHWRDTESHFRHLVAYAPGHPMAHYGLGQSLHQQERYQEAAQEYAQVLEAAPNYAEAWHDLGACLFEQGRYAAAIKQYERSIKLKPDLAELHRSLGVAQDALRYTSKAIKSYRRAIELEPTGALAHADLAKTLYEHERVEEALTEFRLSLRYNPKLTTARNGLGVILSETGRTDEAIEEFRIGLRLDPTNAELHNSLANAYLKKQDVQSAIEHYNRAVEYLPDYAIAQHNLAVALANTGKVKEAIRHHRLAIEADPAYVEARINLANLLAGQQRYIEAELQLREAIKLKPNAPAPYNNLATILTWQGRTLEAIETYQNVARLIPNNAAIQCTLGKMFLRLKDREAATKCFRKALSIDPQHKEANAKMKALRGSENTESSP